MLGEWEHDDRVRFDDTVIFGLGYDFEGLEHLRQELHTPHGSYVVWPNQLGGKKKWSAYGGNDGALMMEKFATIDDAKAWVEKEIKQQIEK